MERLLFVVLVLAAALPLIAPIGKRLGKTWPRLLGLLTLTLPLASLSLWDPGLDLELAEALPQLPEGEAFVGSKVCRACHPDQYSTWQKSFHRRMTQAATPEAVLASFDDLTLEDRGQTYRLQRRGDQFWVEMPALWSLETPNGRDLSRLNSLPRVEQRVWMTTGSHHFQAYWIQIPEFNGMFFQFPWYYQVAEDRWIPAADSFLKPPASVPEKTILWNETCIDCHTVGGQPRMKVDERTMFSRAAELGIACESCHGPGREHVRVNRFPWRRYQYHLLARDDPTIVNPSLLDADRASEVCGQCHSVSGPLDPDSWSIQGRAYRAGQPLLDTRRIVRYADAEVDPFLQQWLREEPDALRGRFWTDGTVRVAGREYNGLIESRCFQQGELSCLSCHSMHESDPNDQLARGMEGDEPCFQCHAGYRDRIPQHTHHPAGSSGSSCLNCHMPNTTFGLFTAIRSHRIDNPSAAGSLQTGRPNACNLCHLDRTLKWTAGYLSAWYGQPEPAIGAETSGISASLLWLLRGDAVQRAVAAAAMGWAPAAEASGRDWQAPFLAQLLTDPYSAVRYVSWKSLSRMPGYESFDYDFVGSAAYREERKKAALEVWNASRSTGPPGRLEILLSPQRELRLDLLHELLRHRDDRRVRIIE